MVPLYVVPLSSFEGHTAHQWFAISSHLVTWTNRALRVFFLTPSLLKSIDHLNSP